MESMPGTTTAQMLDAVKVAAEGASVGHANLVDTTNALTASIASNIPGVKNYSQAMGVLNATVGSGDMTMQDLTDAMGTGMLAAVKGYGLSIKDVGAALATFGDNNIRGAKAGTDLRMAVQALAVPVSTATPELDKLGLSATSLADAMQQHGLMGALDLLQDKFKATGVTAKNEGQVLTDIVGKKAGVGLAVLMEQMTRLESKYPQLTKQADDFGQAWATTLQTPQEKLKQLEAGAQAMAITLGNIAMPAASGILGGLDKAMSFVQDHAFASKGLTLGLGTLIAGGLAKGIFSGVESGLSRDREARVAAEDPGPGQAGEHRTGFRAGLPRRRRCTGRHPRWTAPRRPLRAQPGPSRAARSRAVRPGPGKARPGLREHERARVPKARRRPKGPGQPALPPAPSSRGSRSSSCRPPS